jgi:predicted PilT family ATPase
MLEARLNEAPQFMIVVAGPRQIGKSTLVRQALSGHHAAQSNVAHAVLPKTLQHRRGLRVDDVDAVLVSSRIMG